MESETIGKQSTLILSTDSDLFKFLKSSDSASTGGGRSKRDELPRVVPLPPARPEGGGE